MVNTKNESVRSARAWMWESAKGQFPESRLLRDCAGSAIILVYSAKCRVYKRRPLEAVNFSDDADDSRYL
jgi:hypothetical protein